MHPQPGWLRDFIDDPPRLRGGVSLSALREEEGAVRLELRAGDGGSAVLRVVPLLQPYPSALRRLLASRADMDGVLVSHIPPGLEEAADEAGLSYMDPEGGGKVVAPGFFYYASPRRRGPVIQRRRSPFAPKASRVVRGLLDDPARPWRLSEIAQAVDLDPGNVHKVLASLVEGGLVERDDKRYAVADPGSLLEAWADQARPPRERVRLSVPDDLGPAAGRLVGLIDGRAVISGELAAEVLISYLPAESAIVHLFSEEDFEEAKEWASRELISAVPRPYVDLYLSDEGVAHFGSEHDGLPLVSPPQLYVDLAGRRGRGREAAEELRKRIFP